MKTNVIWISVLALMSGGLFSSCHSSHGAGTSTPSADSAPAAASTQPAGASSRDASALRLEPVLGDGDVQNIPALSGASNEFSDPDLLINGNVMSIQKHLVLPDPSQGKPLYLVWPASFGGSQIIGATFDLEDKSDGSATKDLSNGQEVSRDSANARWFISLSQVFAGHETEINPLDEEVLTLYFSLADGTQVTLEIEFTLVGMIPDHVLVSDALSSLSPQINTQGLYNYEVTQLTNPSGRALTVWARASSTAITDTTYISRQDLGFNSGNGQPYLSGSHSYSAQASLDFSGIQVSQVSTPPRDGTATQQWMPAQLGQWVAITLAPGTQLSLTWMASPAPQVPNCQLPQPDSVTVSGCVSTQTIGCMNGSVPVEVNNQCQCASYDSTIVTPLTYATGTATWSVSGGQFVAAVSRDLVVTEAGAKPADLAMPQSSLMDSSSMAQGTNSTGSIVNGAPRFPQCPGGIFK